MKFKHGDKIEWPIGTQGIVHRPDGRAYYTVLADGTYYVRSDAHLLEENARVIEPAPPLTTCPEDAALQIESVASDAVRKYTENFIGPSNAYAYIPYITTTVRLRIRKPLPPVSRRLRGYCS